MVRLNWNAAGERRYQSGVDRGVLYLPGIPGVAWNGLKAVNEESTGGDAVGYYFDGEKYLNVAESEEFAATIEAYSSPDEFGVCDGTSPLANGLFATQQPRRSFGFSYRTLIGNDLEGLSRGYKVHLVYNALAEPASRSHTTLADTPEAESLSWGISTMPVRISGAKPTAHLVLDSTKADPDLLTFLESYLYGAEGISPVLPTPTQLVSLFNAWQPLGLTVPMKFQGVGSSELKTYKNLATNPSFEATSGTVEVRRNLASDPRATKNGNVPGQANWAPRWAGSGGTVTTSLVTSSDTNGPWLSQIYFIPTYMRKTWTVSGGVSETGFDHTAATYSTTAMDTAGLPVTPGATYTFSSYMRASVVPTSSTATTFAMGVTFRDSFGARILPRPEFVRVTPVANEWVRVALTATAPAGAATVSVGTDVLGSGIWPVGATLDGTGLLIEQTSDLGAYFDGAYSPDSEFAASWAGTANASPSILAGARAAGDVYGGVSYQSGHWASSGTKSVLFRSTRATVGEAIVFLFGKWGQLSGMEPGKTYTIMAKIRMTGPITESAASRRIALRGAGTTTQSSDQWPNAAGVHDVRFTVTLGTSATEAIVQLQHQGVASDPPIWVDDLLIMEGEYAGPWFDGSQLPALAKNEVQNPRGTAPTGLAGAALSPQWYGGSGGNGITTYVEAEDGPEVSPGVRLSTYGRKTWTVAGGFNALSWQLNSNGRPAVTPGEVITVSLYWRKSEPVSPVANMMIAEFYDSAHGGNKIGPTVNGPNYPNPGTDWQRVSATFVVPAGATHVQFPHLLNLGSTSNVKVGMTVDATGAMLERNISTPSDYLDGSMPDGIWLGSPNNSASIRYDTRQSVHWDGEANRSSSTLEQLSVLKVPTETGESYLIDGELWFYDGRIWQNKGTNPLPV